MKKKRKKRHTTDCCMSLEKLSKKCPDEKKNAHKTTKGEWMNERLQKYVMLMSLSQNHYSTFVCFSIRWFGSLVCSSFRSLFHFIFFFIAHNVFACCTCLSGHPEILFVFFRQIQCVCSDFQCSVFKALSAPSLIVGFVIIIYSYHYYYYYYYDCNKISQSVATLHVACIANGIINVHHPIHKAANSQ